MKKPKLLKKYVSDKMIANVHGGYEEVCREYLDDCIYSVKIISLLPQIQFII